MDASLSRKFEELISGVQVGSEDPVLSALIGDSLSKVVHRTGWLTLVLFPGVTSTKVAIYNGLTLVARGEVHVQPGEIDDVDTRFADILRWMERKGVKPSELSGIAARGGFIGSVPTGTYQVSDEMVADLGHASHWHASNMSIPIARRIGYLAGEDVVITTTDPVTCDEIDLLFRMTGAPGIRTDGTAAHYLDLRATCRLTAYLLGRAAEEVHVAACHLGGGVSAVRSQGGQLVQVHSAFGNMPSMTRAGRLPYKDILSLLDSKQLTVQNLKRQIFESDAGLLGWAGTNDFRAFLAFRETGATLEQKTKIDLITDFFATRIAAGMLELTATETELDAIVFTGGITNSDRFMNLVRQKMHVSVPVTCTKGSFELQGLAAGLLSVCVDSDNAKDYVGARNRLADLRETDDAVLGVPIFKRPVIRRAEGSPLTSMDDIISAALPKGELPTIAIAGADNEEALLAAKTASSEGSYRMARFILVGPYARVSELAWELDIPIDDENYFLIDSDDPVTTASKLFEEGVVDILMKGSVTTASLLKGYFGALKASGRLKKGSILSHISLFEIPGRPKLIGLTDAAINPNPDLPTRKAILENALGALKCLGITRPKVAIVSSIEKVSNKVQSSVDGRELAELYADRDDLIVEGPISFDLALSPEAVRDKQYEGKIRGDADLMVVPMIDVGNVVYKSFTTVGSAIPAGSVIGGEAPLILTSRGDSSRSKLASIALALLLARKNRQGDAP